MKALLEFCCAGMSLWHCMSVEQAGKAGLLLECLVLADVDWRPAVYLWDDVACQIRTIYGIIIRNMLKEAWRWDALYISRS